MALFAQSVVTVSINSILNETIQLTAHSVNKILRVMNVESEISKALKVIFNKIDIHYYTNFNLFKAFRSCSILRSLCCVEAGKIW